jgi:hypothetical protein
MKSTNQKKEYTAPAVKIVALKQATSLMSSSACVFPACMEVEKN